MTRKYLEDNDVEFDILEVDLLAEAIAKVKELSNGTSFPVVVVDDEVIVGFNKKRIKELLSL
jgi:glutaredoxin